ncbi:MAG: hypothetical protein J5I53_02165 [Bradyrhizobiaceae bacterium]|nr:hypothetical protein [Bradyrhizobiaceae bacterium]
MTRIICLTAISLLLITACSENSTDATGGGKSWFGSILTIVDFDGVIASADTANVNAVLLLSQNYSELRDWDNSSNLTYTEHEATVAFRPTIDSATVITDISVNGTSLAVSSKGAAWGFDSEGLQTYFSTGSTTNTVTKVYSDPALGTIDTSVVFGERVRFSGFNRLDTIDISNGKTIYFTGAGGFMQITVTVTQPDDPEESGGHSLSKVFDGNSTVTLSSGELDDLVSGKADVEVIKYDPKTVTTSSGKKIIFVGRTAHRVSIHLVD